MDATRKRSLLLHVCCGPCATHSIRTLQADYDVSLYFSNSNVAPAAEYEKRLAEARRVAAICGVPLLVDVYEHEAWLAAVRGLEDEPEKGRRCERCFEFNLARTAHWATDHAFDLFTTTLTISPHKDAALIFRIGGRLGPFLAMDFKKAGGFKRSVDLSREYGLYRQSYCGCEFSAR